MGSFGLVTDSEKLEAQSAAAVSVIVPLRNRLKYFIQEFEVCGLRFDVRSLDRSLATPRTTFQQKDNRPEARNGFSALRILKVKVKDSASSDRELSVSGPHAWAAVGRPKHDGVPGGGSKSWNCGLSLALERSSVVSRY
ncbi:hypothetical protein IFR05_014700 [Cadophora sp. M221]|nr:hypothetical protein IFR05_014700 [Cadophora sp. M221]